MQAHYSNTNILRATSATATFDLVVADYGMIQHIWAFSSANSGESVGMWNTTDTHVAFTGMRLGKGVFSMAIFETTRVVAVAADTLTYAAATKNWLSSAASGVSYVGANAYTREIKSPKGGVAQFKGLTQDATNDQYVEVNCR